MDVAIFLALKDDSPIPQSNLQLWLFFHHGNRLEKILPQSADTELEEYSCIKYHQML